MHLYEYSFVFHLKLSFTIDSIVLTKLDQIDCVEVLVDGGLSLEIGEYATLCVLSIFSQKHIPKCGGGVYGSFHFMINF